MKFLSTLAIMSLLIVAQAPTTLGQEGSKPKLGVSLELNGTVLDQVTEGSVANQAGLQAGDYLMSWGDIKTDSIDKVLEARGAAVAGTETSFTVRRGGKTMTLRFRLPATFPEGGLKLGVTVGYGVYVSSTRPGSAAAEAGIKAGDIITSFSGEEIENFDDLKKQLSTVRPGTTHSVGLQRGAKEMTVKVKFAGEKTHGRRGGRPRIGLGQGQGGGFPFGMKGLDKFQVPGMQMFKNLMGLDAVKAELDKSIVELEGLGNPALAITIKRLRETSAKLGETVRGMAEMRRMAGSFMGGMPEGMGLNKFLGEEEIVEEEPAREVIIEESFPQHQSLMKRIEELVQGGVTDPDELNKIIKKEFPAVNVEIGTDMEHSEESAEVEEIEEVPMEKKTTSKPTSRPAPRAKSKPSSRPSSRRG